MESCLRSVKRQSYSKIEIIIVDNHSTDKTREISKNYGARVVLYRGLRSKARNIGVSLSNGEFILSLDSDIKLKNNVIKNCATKMMNGFDAVIIPELSVGEGFWATCKALEKKCYVGDDLIEAARFFRKSSFDAIGGYDVDLEAGEDWDLNQRLKSNNYKINRIKSFLVHNEGRLSLRNTITKKRYYGNTIKFYQQKHPLLSKKQLGIIRLCFIKHWSVLAMDPTYAVGLFFMKICEFTAGWLATID